MASRLPNRAKRVRPGSVPADDAIDAQAEQDADETEDAEAAAEAEDAEQDRALAPTSGYAPSVAAGATVTHRPWTDSLPRWIPAYLRESLSELGKVTWPARQETINLTILVIALALAFAAVFGLVDLGLGNLVTTIANRLTGS